MRKALRIIAIAVLLIAPAVFAQQAIQGTLLASTPRTATASSADINNLGNRGTHIIINVSAYTSGTWTPRIQGKNPITGVYYDILVGSGITGTGVTVLKVYPGMTAAANLAASDALPKTWRLQMTGTLTPVATFSVGYFSIP